MSINFAIEHILPNLLSIYIKYILKYNILDIMNRVIAGKSMIVALGMGLVQ